MKTLLVAIVVLASSSCYAGSSDMRGMAAALEEFGRQQREQQYQANEAQNRHYRELAEQLRRDREQRELQEYRDNLRGTVNGGMQPKDVDGKIFPPPAYRH